MMGEHPMKTALPAYEYSPYDDRTQSLRQIDRYPASFTRVPASPLVPRPLTLSERTGPTELPRQWNAGPLNLSRTVENGPRALGQLISLTGRVTDEDGSPVAGVVMELWQANAAGKYVHAMDDHIAPLDPNFIGQGRLVTDQDGRYQVFTVKPGAYPVLYSGWWWRPPHIHFSILGTSWMNRFVTQIFFPGEPLNQTDLLLNGVPDKDVRQRLIFEPSDTVMGELSYLGFRRDFVLRGHRRTPEMA
jgi:protocatechuate 3,4-dioxygenase beta subunit